MLDTKALAEATAAIVRQHVEAATAPLVERIAVLEGRRAAPGEPGQPGRDGTDGKDVDPADVAAMIEEAVTKAVAAIPAPQNGQDGRDGTDGRDGADGIGKDGADGKDGAGIADLLLDRDGSLVATFTNGRIKSLGGVVGKDGRDGEPGADGADGIGFEDLQFEHDGERGFTLKFVRGERVKEFAFSVPVVIDRGVWREGAHAKGDFVTWAGSGWIAQKDTDAKPDAADGSWRLAIKKGRDGKDKA